MHHTTLANYYKTVFDVVFANKSLSLDVFEQLYCFERDIYIGLINEDAAAKQEAALLSRQKAMIAEQARANKGI